MAAGRRGTGCEGAVLRLRATPQRLTVRGPSSLTQNCAWLQVPLGALGALGALPLGALPLGALPLRIFWAAACASLDVLAPK